jgi:N-methylhydantoinase B
MVDPIGLEIFKCLFSSIAEEMGEVLRKASYSPNIKERRDFSCAVFDKLGRMIAQAAHIPVHLGSMPASVEAAIAKFNQLKQGDTVILNDPFHGGTHLPDITLVSPVFSEPGDNPVSLVGYVASRAHHADVGGMSPGSMTVSREVFQEGLIIPPVRIVEQGTLRDDVIDLILANVRTPEERSGDLMAQIAANQRGISRLGEMVTRYGGGLIAEYMDALLVYAEKLTRELLTRLPDGIYSFEDRLDDDGFGNAPVPICVSVTVAGNSAVVDFSGSAEQQTGPVNAVYAITLSAVHYVFRCLIGLDVPNNSGCMKPIHLIAPQGSVVNAIKPAAVAGGNVETSQRIVDVLLGAFSRIPDDINGDNFFINVPAASQGTMNNVTIGGKDPASGKEFTYYETIAGGAGASRNSAGASAIHSHMTNTLNTPIEAIEYAYPLQVFEYSLRKGSGGAGNHMGGDGIRRDLLVKHDARLSLLTERRKFSPYGICGGSEGEKGENILIRDGKEIQLPGKGFLDLKAGDIISVRTPGGGGFGKEKSGSGPS